MISVCIATYNGSKYIKEQLESILSQLGEDDEVVVSDDSSTDSTIEVIGTFCDPRIKVCPCQHFKSPVYNFENALKMAKGDYIFLSDQDDVWEPNKVEVMMRHLQGSTLVTSDCSIVDADMQVIRASFCFDKPRPKGVISNLLHNNFLGCCMAFRKELLDRALPFPADLAMHDIWLGICASAFYSVEFIPDKLIKYRRHGDNASCTGEKSHLSWSYRITYRCHFLKELLKRKYLQ